MKQILPILTLTTLAAAASAQSAPAAAGLDYNCVGFSRSSQDNNLSAQVLVGNSNVLVGIQSNNVQSQANYQGLFGSVQFTLGYVFKNVVWATDVVVTANQSTSYTSNYPSDRTVYGVTFRRQLNEVINGLEGSVGFTTTGSNATKSGFTVGGATNDAPSAWNTELAYNINKNYQVAAGLVSFKGQDYQYVLSVRYNF